MSYNWPPKPLQKNTAGGGRTDKHKEYALFLPDVQQITNWSSMLGQFKLTDEPASVLLDKIRQENERLIKEKKIKRDKNTSIIYRGEDNRRSLALDTKS